MHAIIFNTLFTLFTYLALFQRAFVTAVPLPRSSLVERASKSSSSSSSGSTSGTFLAKAPRWVTYSDMEIGGGTVVPSADELNGFNVFILAFYLSSGPSDQVLNFINLSESKRKAIIKDLHSNGISLMMSVFGSTDKPTTDGVDPKAFASKVAGFVKKYGLDGVDVDYEDFDAINNGSGDAERWLVTFTNSLRSHLPSGQYFITHAPVAPWFTTDKGSYPHGAYRTVANKAGDNIDWYNIQYYNQENNYSKCSHIITASPSSPYPHTSISEINKKSGVPLEKLVIGKPAKASDADEKETQLSRSALASCIQQAKENLGWNAGAMFWEWPHSAGGLISSVRELAFPVLGNL